MIGFGLFIGFVKKLRNRKSVENLKTVDGFVFEHNEGVCRDIAAPLVLKK